MPRAQCIVFRDNRVLMVQHRYQGQEWWCLPGGGTEQGETPAQAAVRELAEECHVEGTLVRETARWWYRAEDVTYTYLVEIGDQEPRLGADPEFEPGEQVLSDMRWMRLCEIPERDRCFLWAAGLLGVGSIDKEIESWGDDPSYPKASDALGGHRGASRWDMGPPLQSQE